MLAHPVAKYCSCGDEDCGVASRARKSAATVCAKSAEFGGPCRTMSTCPCCKTNTHTHTYIYMVMVMCRNVSDFRPINTGQLSHHSAEGVGSSCKYCVCVCIRTLHIYEMHLEHRRGCLEVCGALLVEQSLIRLAHGVQDNRRACSSEICIWCNRGM